MISILDYTISGKAATYRNIDDIVFDILYDIGEQGLSKITFLIYDGIEVKIDHTNETIELNIASSNE